MTHALRAESVGRSAACQEPPPPPDPLAMTLFTQSTVSSYIAEPPRVGEPDLAGALAVFPLLGSPGELRYLSFAQGLRSGVVVAELERKASVGDLLVHNPTDTPVLLYEGEQVLGAQQDRTFDVSVLVAPRSKLRVPVSCVEAGRWDRARHGESFVPAPQVAYPALRRAKSGHVRRAAAVGLEARADQGAVWADVAARGTVLGIKSETGGDA